MSWLLDVNLILATRWTTHPDHSAAKAWSGSVDQFYTTAITELGFVRVSLSCLSGNLGRNTGEFEKAGARAGCQFLADDVNGTRSPETSSKDTTDAHLVTLAKRHGLKLATLDGGLIGQPWAAGIAENPLLSPKPSSTNG